MRERTVELVNPLGLHARAAAKLVRCAGQFTSIVTIHNRVNNSFANGKSILSLLTLGGSFGVKLEIKIVGDDEAEAMTAIVELFVNGFSEI